MAILVASGETRGAIVKKEMMSEWTRQELCAALFSLMREKPLDKISVREISEACDIPRSTFYYHFTDIYDLHPLRCPAGCLSAWAPTAIAFCGATACLPFSIAAASTARYAAAL